MQWQLFHASFDLAKEARGADAEFGAWNINIEILKNQSTKKLLNNLTFSVAPQTN